MSECPIVSYCISCNLKVNVRFDMLDFLYISNSNVSWSCSFNRKWWIINKINAGRSLHWDAEKNVLTGQNRPDVNGRIFLVYVGPSIQISVFIFCYYMFVVYTHIYHIYKIHKCRGGIEKISRASVLSYSSQSGKKGYARCTCRTFFRL